MERFLLPSVDSRAHPSVRSLFHPKDDYGLSKEKLFSPFAEGGRRTSRYFFILPPPSSFSPSPPLPFPLFSLFDILT